MSRHKRLAVFLSALWVTMVLMAYVVDAPSFRWDAFFLFGALPVTLIWNVAWVIAGFRGGAGRARS
jgi:hypothetical protein